MKIYNIKKLDKRHKGYGRYQYLVEPSLSVNRPLRIQRFQEWREWCWTSFGPSMERTFIDLGYNAVDYKWTWFTDEYSIRLYFQTEKELNWFVLAWSNLAPAQG